MPGFLPNSDLLSSRPIPTLIPRCDLCQLYRHCQSPKMPVFGEGQKRILVIGEAPGKFEDSNNRPFIGDSGQLLKESFAKFDVDLDRDCWITNSLICHPWEINKETGNKKNRTPTDKEISYCRPNLLKAIDEFKPDTIILLGHSAVKSLIGYVWQEKVGEIGRWIGWRVPSVKLNSWICPAWHPSYVMRGDYGNYKDEQANKTRKTIWERHLKRIFRLKGKPHEEPPVYADPQSIKVELDVGVAAKWIRSMIGWGKPIAFDYETSCLKPDSDKAEIVCCSVSDGEVSVAFPWYGEAKTAMRELLKSDVPKIASNLKFEACWSKKEFGFFPRKWLHDTMVSTHVLDNRGSISSIKFQAFVMLGVDSWEGKVSGAFGKGDLIKEVGLERLLRYCAYDSLYEWHVAMRQRRKLR